MCPVLLERITVCCSIIWSFVKVNCCFEFSFNSDSCVSIDIRLHNDGICCNIVIDHSFGLLTLLDVLDSDQSRSVLSGALSFFLLF